MIQQYNKKQVLIIGANSALACHFIKKCVGLNEVEVTTTSRTSNALHFLDLSDVNVDAELRQKDFDVVIVFAGLTRIAQCQLYPELARQINCDAILTLMQIINARHWILFSTNLVHSGAQPCMARDLMTKPFNQYGKSKMEMEQNVAKLPVSAAILRLTKVLTPSFPLLQKMLVKLTSGQPCEVFSDMTMAPIWFDEVILFIASLMSDFKPGIFQLSASCDISYAEALRFCARRLNINEQLVIPVSKPATMLSPAYNSLGISEQEMALGFTARAPEFALNKFLDGFITR